MISSPLLFGRLCFLAGYAEWSGILPGTMKDRQRLEERWWKGMSGLDRMEFVGIFHYAQNDGKG